MLVLPLGLISFKLLSFYLYTDGLLAYVLKVLWAEISFFALVSCIFGSKYMIHIHHYLIGMCSLPLVCYQASYITMLNGFLVGVMIEGGARWGYDQIWYRVDLRQPRLFITDKEPITSEMNRTQNEITLIILN